MSLQTAPQVIASESDVDAGDAKSAYDLSLVRFPNGDLELVLFMKLQFFFEDGPGGAWSEAARSKYVKDWVVAVTNAWSGRRLRTLKGGKSVSVRISFQTQIGGFMWDHWEITVTRINSGGFRTSYVRPGSNEVTLDSEDIVPVTKSGSAGCDQRGAAHEFGHMIGLDDEYKSGHLHKSDLRSVMNSCEDVKDRHVYGLRDWLDAKLRALRID
jgi:hypothetical protein